MDGCRYGPFLALPLSTIARKCFHPILGQNPLLLRTRLVEPLERQTYILSVFRIWVEVIKLTH